MKVLHINSYDVGGAAKAALRLHKKLVEQGTESETLLLNKTSDAIEGVFEIWEEYGFVNKALKLAAKKALERKHRKTTDGIGPLQELFSFPETIWDVTQSKHYQNADVIHLHWIVDFVDLTSFFNQCDKPIVWTMHDFWPFLGGFHYSCAQSGSLVKEVEANLHQVSKALRDTKVQFVSPSQYLCDFLQNDGIASQYNCTVIQNGIDVSTFRYREKEECRQELGLSQEDQILLFVADKLDYPRKGYHILLDALTKLDEVLLVAVGHGAGDSERIINLGTITDEHHLALVYGAADVFVIPSLDDNLPNTVLESLCCGTPVVGFNKGGIPEMIKHATCGLIVENPDANSLTEGVRQALDRDWDRETISKQATDQYGTYKCATQYLELYQKVLDQHRNYSA